MRDICDADLMMNGSGLDTRGDGVGGKEGYRQGGRVLCGEMHGRCVADIEMGVGKRGRKVTNEKLMLYSKVERKGKREKEKRMDVGRCRDESSEEAGEAVENEVLTTESPTYYISSNVQQETSKMDIVMAEQLTHGLP